MSEDEPNALYRRYRPQRFADLVGQESTAAALVKAVAEDRVSHAYLFHGPRGTGKTSTARILAKALNCTNRLGAEPCNECDSCVSINEGTSLDVTEYDAASNSGVDSMRSIISDVALASPGRRKVIVIDEAHMLSTSAFNAFLKTLENPPSHVVFILATTDPHKVIATIRSRCQPFPFRLVAPEILTEHLENVAVDAGLDIGPDVIKSAVLTGRGSVRDALSALDVLALSGVPENSHPVLLLNALATGSVLEVFKVIAESSKEGVPARYLAEETVGLLRECFLIQMNAQDLLTTPDWGNRAQTATTLGAKKTVQAIDALGDAIRAMASDNDARVNLEINLARYCKTAG